VKHRSQPRPISRTLAARFARVKILLCDVDGVLTNATVFIGDGREFKEFHIQDGLGLRLLQREGVKVGWISNRPSTATRQRAEELKIDFLHQDKGSKVAAAETILAQAGLSWVNVCYVGDDVVDLGALKRAGVAVAVANAIDEAKALADHVTQAEGGHGAVREVVGLILKAQNRWPRLVREYSA
jgi:3-deoxy-D-manno-octulosonate 8-phosphate phosphatase (KDO 8-P phosphatase)